MEPASLDESVKVAVRWAVLAAGAPLTVVSGGVESTTGGGGGAGGVGFPPRLSLYRDTRGAFVTLSRRCAVVAGNELRIAE